MSRKINNFYDVQQLLKSYGFLIYFKNPREYVRNDSTGDFIIVSI